MTGVLVTGVGGSGVGQQILKALLFAREGGSSYRIYGSDFDALSSSINEGWSKVRLPLASHKDYANELIGFCVQQGVRGVFPGSDMEMRVLATELERLESNGIAFLGNNLATIEVCSDKYALTKRLESLGFQVPESLVIQEFEDINRVDFFPVIVKPNTGGRGSNDVYLAQDRHELVSLATYLHVGNGSQAFLVQRYIGTPDSEFTIGVLSDQSAEIIDSIAVKKDLTKSLSVRTSVENRTSARELGESLVVSSGISQGTIGKHKPYSEMAEAIALALGSTGPLNIQARIHQGRLFVFEINPRSSGTTFFRALVGMNEPDLLIKERILKKELPRNRDWPEVKIERSISEKIC